MQGGPRRLHQRTAPRCAWKRDQYERRCEYGEGLASNRPGQVLKCQVFNSRNRRPDDMWGLDEHWCAVVLSTLVGERFLRLTSNGRYRGTRPSAAAAGS